MIETFEERCKRELQSIIAEETATKMIKQIDTFLYIFSEDGKKDLKLLGDILSLEFLPKKQILVERTKQVKLVCTSRKPQINIEYKADVIYDLIKQSGLEMPFYVVQKYCMAKDVQKTMGPNKYINIDKTR